jgi:DUF1680 family protein
MELVNPANLKLSGTFEERLQRSVRHLLELNTAEMRMEFTQPNEQWHWGADYMGRWIAVMALLGEYTGQDYEVDKVVDELIQFQQPDGSFGAYGESHDFQEWFGMGRGLIGLLEYYRLHPDDQVIESAVRLGDYYAAHYPEVTDCMHECYSNALEGLVALARLTGEPRHMETARRVAETSNVYRRVWFSKRLAANGRRSPYSGQVHCTLLTTRGLAELYRLTGEARYLEPVQALHAYLRDEMLWISGGIGFYFFRPDENETCADADWLRLNLLLWEVTGEISYLELAERILLNQLFFDQADNGGFCYLRGLQSRAGATFDACCSYHGPRALYETMRYIYTLEPGVVQANLYLEGEASLPVHGHSLRIASVHSYRPNELAIAFTLTDVPPDRFTLRLRIPEWAGQGILSVNSGTHEVIAKPGYASLERQWSNGDVVTLRLPLEVKLAKPHTLGKHVLYPNEAAIFYGPRLFCLTDDLNLGVPVHLVRLNPGAAFKLETSERLQAQGILPDGSQVPLVYSPLDSIGGTPSGMGRIHTVRAPYFKVWIPLQGNHDPAGRPEERL